MVVGHGVVLVVYNVFGYSTLLVSEMLSSSRCQPGIHSPSHFELLGCFVKL